MKTEVERKIVENSVRILNTYYFSSLLLLPNSKEVITTLNGNWSFPIPRHQWQSIHLFRLGAPQLLAVTAKNNVSKAEKGKGRIAYFLGDP